MSKVCNFKTKTVQVITTNKNAIIDKKLNCYGILWSELKTFTFIFAGQITFMSPTVHLYSEVKAVTEWQTGFIGQPGQPL